MAARRGPTFRRRELGKELRRLRERKGYGTKEAAAAIESSESKLNRVESGHNQLPRVRDLEDLLDFYGVTERTDREHILALHRDSLSDDWYRPYHNYMPSGQPLYVGLESDATAMRAWHCQVVFGLLQTENYARALFMTSKPVDERTTEFVEENVAFRMKRKEIIYRDDHPFELRVILDEATLRRVIGGPDIMREQYQEIEKLASLDHVTVQILPQNLATYRTFHNFVILDFDGGLDPVVMTEGIVMTVSDKRREVWQHARKFDAMREGALAPAKTGEFLHRLAREIDEN
ncbi:MULTISPECIES: helix-turn-helix domain-containing protein [Streptomyces]|uniref:Helix-turn-helix domain-containing protein n=1 Tax=Streptomyces griseocarneus TaxID=51201 RepID=A0ABX7RH67_9ACTN|nr:MULTISPECIES: helix-turn-helix transcriptional regulator [Streptomyces]QSY47187.1 helix-turn-helix domain-containing protein [Streptomyces griseocarneus]